MLRSYTFEDALGARRQGGVCLRGGDLFLSMLCLLHYVLLHAGIEVSVSVIYGTQLCSVANQV